MLNLEATSHQSTITLDPSASPVEARGAVAAAVAQACGALGPTIWPTIFYQTGDDPLRVTVVFVAGESVMDPGEIEELILERIVRPPALARSAQAARARGPGVDDGWIRLATGGRFYPLRPDPASITLYNIASGLSRECRYGGQLERLEFYSAAEHCVHLSRVVPPKLARWALLHDASEGLGLKDIARPIKAAMGPAYEAAEDALTRAVAVRFGLLWPIPAELKVFDTRILQNERTAIWSEPQSWVTDAAGPPLPGVEIRGWLPYEARTQFLRMADELGIREVSP
jgi:hypothetical protein